MGECVSMTNAVEHNLTHQRTYVKSRPHRS